MSYGAESSKSEKDHKQIFCFWRSEPGRLCALLAIALMWVAAPADALTVSMVVAAKSQTNTTIDHAAGSTVTISVAVLPFSAANPIPPPPAGIPTFTWNLYDADGFGAREQNAIDFTQVDATKPPNGWVFRLTSPKKNVILNGVYDYTYTALPVLSLAASDSVGMPDAFVEVIATLGAATATDDVCTPDLPSVGQGDLGVSQPLGSSAPMSNARGLSDYPIRAFSRGYDEICDLLDAGSGVDPAIFVSSEDFVGSLPIPEFGPLVLYTAPASGEACADEAAGGVGSSLTVSFFNMNTGEPGLGVATDEYYFVRENDTLIEYSATGDIDATVVYFDLDDLSGRAVSALAVDDHGVRGVFEPDDKLIYAYVGTPELWVLTGPLDEPTILSANGHTFDGTATFDFGHLTDDGSPGSTALLTQSITSISVASNLANIQPVPSDRAFADYDGVPLAAFFDDFEGGSVGLFTDIVGSVFDFEDDPMTFGGQREVAIDVSTTEGSGVFAATTNGVYTHDQSNDTFARSEVIWDGTDASVILPGAGSLALDLEADPSNAFVIAIQRIENFSGETPLPSIGVFVELDEPGRPRTEVTFPFTGPIVMEDYLVLPYHLFGPDLSNVAAVGLVVDGTTNADFFTEISSVTTTAVDTFPPIVDSFDEPQISISRSTVGSEFAFHRNPITMTGEVEVSADVLLSENIGNLDVMLGEGSLNWSQGMSILAEGSIVWDGMDGSPSTEVASAVNLTNHEAGALELTIDSLTFDSGVTGGVGLSVEVVSRTNPGQTFVSPSFQLTTPIVSGQTIVIPFADFSGEGSGPPSQSELSEISSLSLHVDGGAQSEFSLSLGDLRTVPMPVPEPGLVSALMAGSMMIAVLRRRRSVDRG